MNGGRTISKKAKKGDLIRIVNAMPYYDEDYKNGDIFEVKKRHRRDSVKIWETDEDFDWIVVNDSEYVIYKRNK